VTSDANAHRSDVPSLELEPRLTHRLTYALVAGRKQAYGEKGYELASYGTLLHVQLLPFLGKLGSSKISYAALASCLHLTIDSNSSAGAFYAILVLSFYYCPIVAAIIKESSGGRRTQNNKYPSPLSNHKGLLLNDCII